MKNINIGIQPASTYHDHDDNVYDDNDDESDDSNKGAPSISSRAKTTSHTVLSHYIKQLEKTLPTELDRESSIHAIDELHSPNLRPQLQNKSSFHALTNHFMNHSHAVHLAKVHPIHNLESLESTVHHRPEPHKQISEVTLTNSIRSGDDNEAFRKNSDDNSKINQLSLTSSPNSSSVQLNTSQNRTIRNLQRPQDDSRNSLYENTPHTPHAISSSRKNSTSINSRTLKPNNDLNIGKRISTHLFLKATLKTKSFITRLHDAVDLKDDDDDDDNHENKSDYHNNHHNVHSNGGPTESGHTFEKESSFGSKCRKVSIANQITQNWHEIPSPPSSLYSYSILFCLREGQFSKYADDHRDGDILDRILDQLYVFFVIIPQLVVVAFVQFVILSELWSSLPSLRFSPFCQNWRPKMDFAVVFAFVCSLLPSLNDLITDAKIAFRGRYLYVGGKEYRLEGAFSWYRPVTSILPTFVVIYEAGVWVGVMVVGAYYTITSDMIGDIIQACVAIVFVNEIDNMAFWILDNNEEKEDDDKYGKVVHTVMVNKDTQKVVRTLLGIPLISGLVCIVIFTLKAVNCIDNIH